MELRNRESVQFVKRARESFGVSIDDAHDMQFADEEMRRLVAWRVDIDPECRKQAFWNIRHKSRRSRFIREGERIMFRESNSES